VKADLDFEAEDLGALGERDGVSEVVGELGAGFGGIDEDAQADPVVPVVAEDLEAGLGDACSAWGRKETSAPKA